MSSDAVAQRVALHARNAATSAPTLHAKAPSPHALRHTCAMRMLASGLDITTIALRLGHASPAATRHYLHADLGLSGRGQGRERVGQVGGMGRARRCGVGRGRRVVAARLGGSTAALGWSRGRRPVEVHVAGTVVVAGAWRLRSGSDERDGDGDGEQRAPCDEVGEGQVGGWRARMDGPLRVTRWAAWRPGR